jgi:hypothetical protein
VLGQALIFVTRTRYLFFLQRPSLLLALAFLAAQVSSILSVFSSLFFPSPRRQLFLFSLWAIWLVPRLLSSFYCSLWTVNFDKCPEHPPQLIATFIAVYWSWEFTFTEKIGWGWAASVWIWDISECRFNAQL